MLETRAQVENVLRFPRAIPSVDRVGQVARWMAAQTGPLGLSWRLMEDTDGALLLVPIARPEPGFAIMMCDGEYEVMVCDPDDLDELGPFESMADALAGISHWLALPAIEISDDAVITGQDAMVRPSFPLLCPADPIRTIPTQRT